MFRSFVLSTVVCALLLCVNGAAMSAAKAKSNVFKDNMTFLTKIPKVYDFPYVQVLV